MPVGDVARQQEAARALGLDRLARRLGVVVLVEIDDRDVGAFARVQDGDGAADAGIAAGDERDLARSFPEPL